MIWQFRDADPEFGQLQAKELHDQLVTILEKFQLDVLLEFDYVEVRPEGGDKGVMVDRIVSTIESSNDTYVDFILCIGDDSSDEYMFSYLEDDTFKAHHSAKVFTCTVGKKPSAAKTFLNNVEEVHEVLRSLTKVTMTANRNLSMNDLRSFDSSSGPSSNLLEITRNFNHANSMTDAGEKNSRTDAFYQYHNPEDKNPARDNVGEPALAGNSLLGTGGKKTSMSMTALSSMSSMGQNRSMSHATLDQYFESLAEEGEEEADGGGIFF